MPIPPLLREGSILRRRLESWVHNGCLYQDHGFAGVIAKLYYDGREGGASRDTIGSFPWWEWLVARLLVILGVVLIVAGFAWGARDRLPWQRFPGDLVLRIGDVRIHVLWAISLVLSVVLSLLLWMTRR
ncbi:DUF2905 family protein [Acidiferrobacter sp.]|uniref:DUF2905 family protein n=1 Tax=Acidiferrobacter sp. TaxID=1872107 RepID=UPI00261447AA|nr:DUF2905 family protein [Acidiferrobacter sp.]